MKAVLELLNQLVTDKVITNYAIGGSVAAFFYIEATHTEDIDAFAVIPQPGLLLSLSSIYDAAKKLGATVEGEHLQVGDWKLQVLPPKNALVEEALDKAKGVDFHGVPTHVMDPEYLCAVMVDTGRQKDHLRLLEFVKHKKVNVPKLTEICEKHKLKQKLENWLSSPGKYTDDPSPVASNIREAKISFRRFVQSLGWEEKIKVVERLQRNANEIKKYR